MDDLDSAIVAADHDYRQTAFAHAQTTDRLVFLLATRIARNVRDVAAFRGATGVGVDGDHQLDMVCTLTDVLAERNGDPGFEQVAAQIRGDLLRIAETGHFHADNRLLQLPHTPSTRGR
ncbi:hypothetical protein E0F15_17785 [Frankia sp. B2]|uniref:hypothetical protein n=1 Tax=unclassified Frankia TaxID=2632575 RepID=UPI0006CA4C94|nr:MULTISPECIES: hypothetical protein [unclassified Frankia]KPM52706.1 hypothetical protein ACG83_24800 [Frankia sp. R43]TFE26490.1 hypothetical protein E0F15_17785 [Frankia sp. B2]